MVVARFIPVIPAQAGIPLPPEGIGTPAFAGVTVARHPS